MVVLTAGGGCMGEDKVREVVEQTMGVEVEGVVVKEEEEEEALLLT